MQLLVVEDDLTVQRALCRVVRCVDASICVQVTATAQRALAVARSGNVDAALVDVALPDGPRSGIDVLHAVREKGNGIPLAVMTGLFAREIVKAAASADALFFPKDDDLHANVERFVRRAAKRRGMSTDMDAPDMLTILGCAAARFGLTPSELDVLRWVATGRRVTDYDDYANVAKSTRKTHVRNILTKTGTSRMDLLVIMLLGEKFLPR